MKNCSIKCLVLISFSHQALAEKTPTALVRPSKLTVGPSDSFDPELSKDGKLLFFTQSQNMSSAIRVLDLKTGVSSALLSLDADSKGPRLSPDGKNLAFTYFRSDAKGDVCYLELSKSKPICISKSNVTDESPVWISNTKLAYVSTAKQGEMASLVVYDLSTRATKVLFQDSIVSPAVSEDLSTLLYVSRGTEIVFYNLANSKEISRKSMGLTGTTGLVRFAADSQSIFFTQYLVDSNRDLKVDARDSGALFRVDYKEGVVSERALQLTSLDQSCSYPMPAAEFLYVTCAFEGSLDLYRIPLTGVIPAVWGPVELDLAHMSARSYAERLLLLAGMYARDEKMTRSEFMGRSMINYYLKKEFRTVENLALLASADLDFMERDVASTLAKVSHARARWELLPGRRVTTAFQAFARSLIQGIEKDSAKNIPVRAIASAHLYYLLGEDSAALAALVSVKTQKWNSILLTYLFDDLWLQLEKNPVQRLSYLKEAVFKNSDVPENQAYYLDLCLDEASRLSDPLKGLDSLSKESAFSEKMRSVIANEIDLNAIAKTDDKKEWIRLGQAGTKRLQDLGKDYYLKRLMMSRSVRFFSSRAKTEQLTNVSSLWLSYVRNTEMEFSHVLEVFRINTTESAYQFLADGQSKEKAKGAFFNNLRMSDNLEAHSMYSALSPLPAEQEDIRTQYGLMITDKLIRPESLEFSQLVHRLTTALAKLAVKDLEEGLKLCEKLPDDQVGAGLKYHVIGFLHHRILDLTTKGFVYDTDRAELAHKSYLLAIDLALGNERLQASSLENLGALHYSIRNYSLSSDYYTKRMGMGFTSKASESALRWIFARSLYRSNRYSESLEQCEAGLKTYEGSQKIPWSEKCGFYALSAGNYKRSEVYYETVFAGASPQSASLNAGTLMAYGYVLSKLGKDEEAHRYLRSAIEKSEKEPPPSSDSDGVVSYHPLKTRWISWGLLSQLKLPLEGRVLALKNRLVIFADLIKSPANFQLSASDLYADELKELQRLAILHAERKDFSEADKVWTQALEKASVYGKTLGFVSQPIQQTLKNFTYNTLWNRQDKMPLSEATDKIEDIVKGMKAELAESYRPSPIFVQTYLEARILYEAYKGGRGEKESQKFEGASRAIFVEQKVAEVLQANSVLKERIESYRAQVQKHLL